jgi:hypothetical protein
MVSRATDGNHDLLEWAQSCVRAGLCVIPIALDGTKAPAWRLLPLVWDEAEQKPKRKWEPFHERRPTDDELRHWFGRPNPPGLALVGGRVSGHLETLDFDSQVATIFPAWSELVEAECPGLVARLSINTTPKPGFHVRYRCPEIAIPGNLNLAIDPAAPQKGERVLIETRGEGGYALVPGCPPACHPSGRIYEHHSGPELCQVQAITAAEREVLIRCARSFDRGVAEAKGTAGGRPGDDFNRRGPDWLDPLLLGSQGWQLARQSGHVRYLRRPGKDGRGWSATVGYCHGEDGVELLAVFSSNIPPFEIPAGKRCGCFSKFTAYALLHHQGQWKVAAKALAQLGYGDGTRRGVGGAEGGQAEPPLTIGSLTLKPGCPRQTSSGKIVVPVVLMRAGNVVDHVTVSDSLSGRKAAAQLIARHRGDDPGDGDGILDILARVIAWAVRELQQARESVDGETIAQVVRRMVPAAFDLQYRTERGAWSEARGVEITRHDFVNFIPSDVMAACALAVDAPRDGRGEIARSALLHAILVELAVLWADISRELPHEVRAELAADSAASAKFREAMVRLWTAPRTFEVVKSMQAGSSDIVAARASLASRANSARLALNNDPAAVRKWHEIQRSFAAWWRLAVKDEEFVVLLAMRWNLVEQIGVELPGVTDQASLTDLGTRYGVLVTDPPVTGRLSGGHRLAVLSSSVTEELLGEPVEDAEIEPEEVPRDASEGF